MRRLRGPRATRGPAGAAAPSTAPTSAVCCPCTSPTATRAWRPAPSPSRATSSRRLPEANIAAVAEVAARAGAELALANHLVMGPVILARALAGEIPYAVKVHGSALEYTVKPEPERFLGLAREGLAPARAVLVGSRHTAESLWETIADPELRARRGSALPVWTWPASAPAGTTGRSPTWAPWPGSGARAAVGPGGRRGQRLRARPRGRLASRWQRWRNRRRGPLVAFVGKLIVSKGPDLLLAAWPLVLERLPDARLLVVGFGAFREGLEALAAALADGGSRAGAGARPRRARAGGRGRRSRANRSATCWRSWMASMAPRPSATCGPPPRSASGSCSPVASSTTSSPACCPPAARWWSRAPSPRPSAWSPPRGPPAGHFRSAPPTRGWPRSARCAAHAPVPRAAAAVLRARPRRRWRRSPRGSSAGWNADPRSGSARARRWWRRCGSRGPGSAWPRA